MSPIENPAMRGPDPRHFDADNPTPNDARVAIDRVALGNWGATWPSSAFYSGALARNVLDLARRGGMSGEDKYALLAYHALRRCEQLLHDAVTKANLETSQRFLMPSPPHG